MKWVAADLAAKLKVFGFYYRARVDLELIIDGQVIDLKSIQFPADTPVRDKRLKK